MCHNLLACNSVINVHIYFFLVQDALVKQYSSMPLEAQISASSSLLNSGLEKLEHNELDISPDCVEGVANVRYALMVLANLLCRQVKEGSVIVMYPQTTASAEYDGRVKDTSQPAPQPLPAIEPPSSPSNETQNVGTQTIDDSAESSHKQITASASKPKMISRVVVLNTSHRLQQPPVDVMPESLDTQDPSTILLEAAQSMYRASFSAGPSHYLAKLIFRQSGLSFLRRLIKEHPWVVPAHFVGMGEVCTSMKYNIT